MTAGILPGLPGGPAYRRRVLELADRQEDMLTSLATLVAFTGDRFSRDRWAHVAGFPQRIPDLEEHKRRIRSGRARALGLIDPTNRKAPE